MRTRPLDTPDDAGSAHRDVPDTSVPEADAFRTISRESGKVVTLEPDSRPSRLCRMRLTRIIIASAAALLVLAAGVTDSLQTRSGEPDTDRPNIVLVMADDQGWGEMGYNGHPDLETPHFDAAATAGLRFDRFYAAAPVCSPTRCSVLTGRHPNRFGCFEWGHTLRPEETTIAEALKTAGYETGHFGKWHVGPARRGSPINPGASGFDVWLSAPNFFDNDPILSRQGEAVQMHGESSMITVEAALEFVREHAAASRPFFAVVWFGSPHVPHEALPEDRARYGDHPENVQHFYGEITAMDRAFGRLRRALDELGIRENTILWYNSDNGGLPEIGATGGRGHKGDVYEGGLRVPGFVEWPGRISSARTTDVPVVTSDLYPTLLDVVDVEIPGQPPLDGISLVPLLDGAMAARKQPIGFWDYPEAGIPTPSAELMKELLEAQRRGDILGDPRHLRLDAWRIGPTRSTDVLPGHAAWLVWPWKLHRIERDGDVAIELYHLGDDPFEENDVAAAHPERTEDMRAALSAWQASVVGSLNGGDYR